MHTKLHYLGFTAAWLLAVSQQPEAAPDFDLTNANSVVKISAHGRGGKTHFGSGVVTGTQEVVTNCHVTRDAHSITISKGARRYRAIAQRVDMHHDLCLLKTSDLNLQPTDMTRPSDSLRLGEPVTVYGYPGGLNFAFFAGTIEALHPFDRGSVIETTASIGLGSSGGGLFDTRGRLVGIATFVPAKSSGRYYAVPLNWLERLRTRPAERIEPLPGVAFWELNEEQQPYFLKVIHLASRHQWKRLEALARRWTDTETRNPEAWFTLGQELLRQGSLQQAQKALNRALSLNRDHAGAWYHLGLIYLRRGDRDHSERVMTRLQRISPALAARLGGNDCTSDC